MTAEGFIRASAELEALAGQLLNTGSARAGGEMLYGALCQVIIAVAIRRGAPYREHQHRRHLIRSLARELDDPDITDAFRFAQRMHVHFYLSMGCWQRRFCWCGKLTASGRCWDGRMDVSLWAATPTRRGKDAVAGASAGSAQ